MQTRQKKRNEKKIEMTAIKKAGGGYFKSNQNSIFINTK